MAQPAVRQSRAQCARCTLVTCARGASTPSPARALPPRCLRRSPPPRLWGCPRRCLTQGPAASTSGPRRGPSSPPQGERVRSGHVVVSEQVGVSSGRRCGDGRSGQPQGQRQGPGEGRTGLRRAERCLLHFALQRGSCSRPSEPGGLSCWRSGSGAFRFPLETTSTTTPASLRTLGLGPGGQARRLSRTRVGPDSPKMAALPRGPLPHRTPSGPSIRFLTPARPAVSLLRSSPHGLAMATYGQNCARRKSSRVLCGVGRR